MVFYVLFQMKILVNGHYCVSHSITDILVKSSIGVTAGHDGIWADSLLASLCLVNLMFLNKAR